MNTSTHSINSAHRRSIRALTLGVALHAAVGLAATPAALADEGAFAPVTQNERSIMLVESKEPSSDTAFVPITQNQLSIMRIESKEAPGGVLAGGGPPDWAQTTNERSIALTESKEATGGILAGGVSDAVPCGNR